MYVNNNLYFVVGNLRYLNIHFQEVVLIYVWPVEKTVSLANSPYFPLSSIIPFVRLTPLHLYCVQDYIFHRRTYTIKVFYKAIFHR